MGSLKEVRGKFHIREKVGFKTFYGIGEHDDKEYVLECKAKHRCEAVTQLKQMCKEKKLKLSYVGFF